MKKKIPGTKTNIYNEVESPRENGESILVVENDQTILVLILIFLEKLRYKTRLFRILSGQANFSLIFATSPQVVLRDKERLNSPSFAPPDLSVN